MKPLDERADVSARFAHGALAAILVVALAVRVIYVLQSRASPYFDEPQMDAAYHVEWARALAAGTEFQPGPFFRAPLYPWFLGLCLRVFGDELLVPRLVQAGVGTLSVALVYLVGHAAFDRRHGLVAAAVAATYWMLVYFDGELLLPVLEVPTALLAVWLALKVVRAPTVRWVFACGLAVGVAALVRPNVLAWAPVLAVWLAWIARGGMRARIALPAALGLGLALPIAPITAYNWFVGHDTALISTQAGVNLWIGNNPASNGSTAVVPGTRADWWGGYYDAIAQAEAHAGRTLRPSEVSDSYTARALAWMRAEPVGALRQLAWKARLFWTNFELGNNQDDRFFALHFGPVLRLLPVGFAGLIAFATLGFVLACGRGRALVPLVSFVVVYIGTIVLFFVCARYRVPVLPALMVLGAHGALTLVDWVRARHFVGAALGSALVALAWWGSVTIPDSIDRSDANGWWNLGALELQHGELEDARASFEHALRAKPNHPYALRSLGVTLSRMGEHAQAERTLRGLLVLDPNDLLAHTALVDACIAAGRFPAAVASARELLAAAPHAASGHYALARALIGGAALDKRAAPAEALDALQRVLELSKDPTERFNACFAQGRLAQEGGHAAEALAAFERALETRAVPDDEGWFWECQRERLASYTALGRHAEARVLAHALQARFQNDVRAVSVLKPFLDS